MAFRLTFTPVFRVLFPTEFQLYKPTPGEEATYSAEITPEEKGMHTIYAYLYDDGRRIARETEYVYAR
jgi:hypothetical protein